MGGDAGGGVATAGGALHVTLCYAPPGEVWLRRIAVPAGTTAIQAIAASGFHTAFPHVNPLAHGLAVYGQTCPPDHVLRHDDRVDILRPLVFDPKESRRRRAAHRL